MRLPKQQELKQAQQITNSLPKATRRKATEASREARSICGGGCACQTTEWFGHNTTFSSKSVLQDLFQDWLRVNNASFSAVLQDSPDPPLGINRGVGVFLQNSVPAPVADDSTLAFVPWELAISRSSVYKLALDADKAFSALRKCLLSIARDPNCFDLLDNSSDDESRLTERLTVLVFLTWQILNIDSLRNTPAAFWQPYIEILPRKFYTPLFLQNEAEKILLKGTGLVGPVTAKLKKLRAEFETLKPHLSLFANEVIENVHFDTWLWADAIFWSRALSFASAVDHTDPVDKDNLRGDDLHLVPLVDFCNHTDGEPTARWHLTHEGIEIRSTSQTSTLKPGSELLFSYGPKSNSELYFIHGFCLPDNKHENVAFPAPILEESLLQNAEGIQASKLETIVDFKRMLILSFGMKPIVEITNHSDPHLPENIGSIFTLDSFIVMIIAVLGEEEGFELENFGNEDDPDLAFVWGDEVITDALALLKHTMESPRYDAILHKIWLNLQKIIRERLDDLRTDEILNVTSDTLHLNILRKSCLELLSRVDNNLIEKLQSF
ncbi:hypothetical protein HK096_001802 [Nowakowskiella sp. JEL0078]|nr:hypothetical protein HK096_001802 [Nowakowskiella sp. JEL0078]